MSDSMRLGLVKAARAAGADPSFWYGSLNPIPIADCVIQRLSGDDWVDEGI